ncbi:MAG: glycine zipper 2TM domain-containing protein [Aquabacterium sp.]
MNQPASKNAMQLVALAAVAVSTVACAGPRGGEYGHYPSSSSATVQARVISSSPVMAQVAVPRQVCYDELRQEPARSSGAGAIVGAIAGGAMGNAVGKGSGRAVATGLGVILGAAVGDRIENDGRPGVMRTVQRCEQQSSYQNQVVGYNVVYEYGGQRYSTQMQHQPGSTIPINVTVNPSDDRGYRYEAPPVYQSYQPAPVVIAPPVRYAPAPVTTVVHRPVIIREVDYVRPVIGYVPPRHHHRHHREERCDERDEHRGHRHHDDGRARWSSRWN